MYIKQVIIRGFKTYKDQVSLAEDFHPGVNVVVGFNGSGKSNFFNAILFVVSDRFGTLRAETRKSLLHEGAGQQVLTAFVEIVFENSDRRMPIDRNEVRIRRTIGVKKDDYQLDGKNATRNEVFNLLESCGFTKSNPYYIVQQGKVAELTLMTDRQRLDLLKEISGATVYDERREESKKLLEDLDARRQKTMDVVQVIRQRIESLEVEQRELVEYQNLERERRCLEFEFSDQEWSNAQAKIDGYEIERREKASLLHEAQRDAAAIREKLTEADADIKQATSQRQPLEFEREDAERVRTLRLDELTRLRLELDDEQKQAKDANQSAVEAEKEKRQLQADIKKAEKEVNAKRPQLQSKQAERARLMHDKQVKEAQRDQLRAKQGRRSQYSSIAARNKALNEDIRRREQRLTQSNASLADTRDKMQKSHKSIEEALEHAKARRRDVKRLESELAQKIGPDLAQINGELEKCAEHQRICMNEREKFRRSVEEKEREVTANQSRLEYTMPRPVRSALIETLRWAENKHVQDRIVGTLLSNIMVNPTYHMAVESIAGSALFNLLVHDDSIASEIVTFVRKGHYGSIVCTPLNQVRPPRQDYPRLDGVTPLTSVIRCSSLAEKVVQQVFGRTVICSTLELCDEVSRKYGLDTITLDGDKVSSRGTLTGGYQDPSRFVRMKYAAAKRSAEEALVDLEPRLRQAEQDLRKAQSSIEALHGQKRSIQDSRGELRSGLTQASEAAQEAENQVRRHTEAANRYKERENELKAVIAELQASIEALRAETSTSTLGDLSPDELVRMQQLTADLKEAESRFEACEDECHLLHRQLLAEEQHLNDFLRKRLHELQTEILRESLQDHAERVEEKERALRRVEAQHEQAKTRLQEVTQHIVKVDANLTALKASQENLTAKAQDAENTIQHCSAQVDDLMMKINAEIKKKNQAEEKLRSLPSVMEDAYMYKGADIALITRNLARVSKDLKKFEHVNKKAIDQFTTFTDQLQALTQEEKQTEESRAAILDYMKKVDDRKEETLHRVLQRVDGHFKRIFSEMVRGGRANLRMLGPDEELDDQVGDAGGAGASAEGVADRIKGVRIEVSFTGQTSASFLQMSQLSGGQKTVVAISLVFAMQRLDPAPFYLFDEIDAALDTQYRTAVARLIASDAANNVQMIITTFRPEIIETADRFYRVSSRNRVSNIACVPREEARKVIEEQALRDNIS
mmetsp:Transcript_92901/g.170300  ORF Transcript_92901/g.170300 Transcript_92901/m.170300 type:complete len:1208 (-) Transcript_92901:208-3831(-)